MLTLCTILPRLFSSARSSWGEEDGPARRMSRRGCGLLPPRPPGRVRRARSSGADEEGPPFPLSLPRGSGVFGLDGVAKVPSENVLRRPRPEDPLCASTRRLASSTRREKRRRTSGSTAGFPAFLATLPGAPSIVGCTGRSLRKMQKQTNDVAACFAASAKPSRRPRSIRIWPVISCRKRSTSQYAS